jgi:hypothetical protein
LHKHGIITIITVTTIITIITITCSDSGRCAGEEALCGQGASQPEEEVEAEAHGGISPHGNGELQR